MEEGRARPLAATDFPLAVGGTEGDLQIPGASGAPIAFLGVSNGALFVQPARPDGGVRCNGSPVAGSRWLFDGDVLRLGEATLAIEKQSGATRLRFDVEIADRAPGMPELVPPSHPPRPAAGAIRPAEFTPHRFGPSERQGHRRRVVPRLLLAGLIAGLVGVAGLLFMARAIEVVVEPDPAEMELEGRLLPIPLGGRYLVLRGSHRLTASLDGYHPFAAELEVGPGTNQRFTFQLERLPGLIEIETVPSAGVEIAVDGEVVGTSPVAALELATGLHQIVGTTERYGVARASIEVEGGGARQRITLELDPSWASVSVSSEPSGASVSVDGEAAGTTPTTLDLIEGEHRLVFAHPGFRPSHSVITVVSGEPLTVPQAALVPADGVLVLVSEPAATVSIDDVYRGETPLEVVLAPDHGHEVTFSEPGFAPFSTMVRLRPGQRERLEVTLRPRLGQVTVVGAPGGAVLRIDGQDRGSAEQTFELTAVPHELEVRKPGYEPYRATVTPKPGFPQTVEVVLRTPKEAAAAATPPVLKVDEEDLVLVEGGRFRMGAPRREPGRRANEAERDVEITRPFYIGVREVTNEAFRRFAAGHDSGFVGDVSLDVDDFPVVRVTWQEAARYCNWLSQQHGLPPFYEDRGGGALVAASPTTIGYRLPTEAEWSLVARYPEGGAAWKYSWGSSLPIPAAATNVADLSSAPIVPAANRGYNDGFEATAPPGSFRANPLGLFDLGGNVAEWVHDVYAVQPATTREILVDPLGPAEGVYHVIRGQSWMSSTVSQLRLSFRDSGNEPRPDLGFRLARFAGPPSATQGDTP